MTHDIRLIACDLDGTLLNDKKELTPRTRAALELAASKGIEFVPSSGRFFRGMPEAVRSLPFLHYVIAVNGASVYDIRNDCSIFSARIPNETAVEMLKIFASFPAEYECYAAGWGYTPADLRERIEEFTSSAFVHSIVKNLRTPVDDLAAYIRSHFDGVEKVQMFTDDKAVLEEAARAVRAAFPDYPVTHALDCNIEVNAPAAGKGNALRSLISHLGITADQVIAFGDGTNDIPMLEAAGTAVVMKNAQPEVLPYADIAAPDCNEEGVARVLEEILGRERL
ncbi:MAG: Cof-type HAD-IIB family hydrolase [Clostridium sp.]|nr:Cof-type HAD-IIB family hydrolase [Clostridium sp.]